MKIDSHTHLLLTKKSQPNWKEIKLFFDIAVAQGLNVLTITEHIDAESFDVLYKSIFIENKFAGKILDDGIIQLPNDLLLVSGVEIPLKGGGEVGLHTKASKILSLNKENSYYSLEELYSELSKENTDFIMIGNHLYVPGKWIEHIEEKLILLDAIEMLPKEIHRKEKYLALSEQLKKPLLSGSDSHVWSQLGLGYNEVELSNYSIRAFKKMIKNNKVSMRLSPEAAKLSEISKIYKEFLMNL